MSVENKSSSEMGAAQPMAVGRKLLPPSTPGGAPAFVSEKQYDAIIRLRERRRRIKVAKERRALKVKDIQRGPNGRFVKTKASQQEDTSGRTIVRFSAALRDCYLRFITTNGYKEVTSVGREAQVSTPLIGFCLPFVATNEAGDIIGEIIYGCEAQGSTPAIGLYWPFVSTNEGGENVDSILYWPLVTANAGEVYFGEIAYGIEASSNTMELGFVCPFTAITGPDENIDETAYGRMVQLSSLAGDFFWTTVATNDEEENIGEVAYNSILNLESPDPTTLLRIMMGSRYSTDQVSEQFENVARLEAPNFTTLLTVMNNAGYDEAADDGHYDVEKVLIKMEGWEPAAGCP